MSGPGQKKKGDMLLGQRFLTVLNSLFSTARIHRDNNILLIQCVERFIEVTEELLKNEDEVTLLTSVGGFYLQQEKVLFQRNAAGLVRKLLDYFQQRNLSGLRLYQGATYASHTEIVAFVRLLNDMADRDDPLRWLQLKMDQAHFPWVEIIDGSETESLESIFMDTGGQEQQTRSAAAKGPDSNAPGRQSRSTVSGKTSRSPDGPGRQRAGDPGAGKKAERRKNRALRTYGYAMYSLQEVADKLRSNRQAGIGKAVHLVQNMVDLIMDDDNILLGLSTIRDYDDYTFTHSVNVAILSVCLGHRIGMSRVSLSRLGLSGLFHDLGKIDVPKKILNKPGRLGKNEFAIMQNHSMNSVRRIVRLRASYEKKACILLGPFEHHLRYDLSGYPRTPRKKPLSLIGRIVAIADVYDAVTSPRSYRRTAMTPDQALGLMLKGSGTAFDPILLKVFINMLGVYPVGTVLQLDAGEMGIVIPSPPGREDSGELWLQLLAGDTRKGFRKQGIISLGRWDPEKGNFNRTILASHHPADFGIQPADFFF